MPTQRWNLFINKAAALAAWSTLVMQNSSLVSVKPKGQQLEQVGALMSEGKIEAVVERSFPITEIAAAHAESASIRVAARTSSG